MAEALKDQGNKAFQAKDYDKAIELFSKALDLDPNNFVLFSNRSAAKAGKRQYASALEDADVSKSIQPGPRVMHARVQPFMVSGNMTKLLTRTKLGSSWRTRRHYRRA
ncbi:hypothetical protein K474DRAFT_564410 [Panus rudis PR-1116 ss-1]|nr:hypothetical protein K474DRAFT_564410 [Panus rudis PR-1116 ss-1]